MAIDQWEKFYEDPGLGSVPPSKIGYKHPKLGTIVQRDDRRSVLPGTSWVHRDKSKKRTHDLPFKTPEEAAEHARTYQSKPKKSIKMYGESVVKEDNNWHPDYFKPGARFRITSGNYTGFKGKIIKRIDDLAVKVELDATSLPNIPKFLTLNVTWLSPISESTIKEASGGYYDNKWEKFSDTNAWEHRDHGTIRKVPRGYQHHHHGSSVPSHAKPFASRKEAMRHAESSKWIPGDTQRKKNAKELSSSKKVRENLKPIKEERPLSSKWVKTAGHDNVYRHPRHGAVYLKKDDHSAKKYGHNGPGWYHADNAGPSHKKPFKSKEEAMRWGAKKDKQYSNENLKPSEKILQLNKILVEAPRCWKDNGPEASGVVKLREAPVEGTVDAMKKRGWRVARLNNSGGVTSYDHPKHGYLWGNNYDDSWKSVDLSGNDDGIKHKSPIDAADYAERRSQKR